MSDQETTCTREYLICIQHILRDYLRLFPQESERLAILSAQVEASDIGICHRKTTPGHLTASALVIEPSYQSVLLIYHKSLKRWLQPGGHLEPNEPPAAAAQRELKEEVGPIEAKMHTWHCANPIPFDIDSHL